jgi:hypothetical protein
LAIPTSDCQEKQREGSASNAFHDFLPMNLMPPTCWPC